MDHNDVLLVVVVKGILGLGLLKLRLRSQH